MALLLVLQLALLGSCREDAWFSGAYPADWALAELKMPAGARDIKFETPGRGSQKASFRAPANPMFIVDMVGDELADKGWMPEDNLPDSQMGKYSRRFRRSADQVSVLIESAFPQKRRKRAPKHAGRSM